MLVAEEEDCRCCLRSFFDAATSFANDLLLLLLAGGPVEVDEDDLLFLLVRLRLYFELPLSLTSFGQYASTSN